MASFLTYDIAFLIIFSVFITFFLYSRKKNLKREGIMFLYRTQVGVKAINYVSDKLSGFLRAIRYLIIAVGFGLMAAMVYMLGQVLYIYVAFPQITQIIKAPPLAPVIPYFPQLFGLQSFFPPFYFVYFLAALTIVAVVHEFSHGLYMRLFKIPIKSTGFVFLGPILGAFVEQDDKKMVKKSNSEQMTTLAAGTFANVVFAAIFLGLLAVFFSMSFTPGGYLFPDYSRVLVPADAITGYGNISAELTEVYTAGNETFYLNPLLKTQLGQNATHIVAYDDAPAIHAGLKGVIIGMNDVKIIGEESVRQFLEDKKPGETILVKTLVTDDNTEHIYNITLAIHPANASKGYLGVAPTTAKSKSAFSSVAAYIMPFRSSSTYYAPTWNSEWVFFIYDLLWWVMIINLFVALFNMLPLGILDGGRFFYLAVLSITKSKKAAKYAFAAITYAIATIFTLMMIFWLAGLV